MELLCLLLAMCAVLGGAIGGQKRQAFTGALLGALLGPVGVLVVLLSTAKGKQCPNCMTEGIHPKAKVCPNCQRDI